MKQYLNSYIFLLKIFYNLNKLKRKNDKTNLKFLNNPRPDAEVKNIKMTTDTEYRHLNTKIEIHHSLVDSLKNGFSDHLHAVSSKVTTECEEPQRS